MICIQINSMNKKNDSLLKEASKFYQVINSYERVRKRDRDNKFN